MHVKPKEHSHRDIHKEDQSGLPDIQFDHAFSKTDYDTERLKSSIMRWKQKGAKGAKVTFHVRPNDDWVMKDIPSAIDEWQSRALMFKTLFA